MVAVYGGAEMEADVVGKGTQAWGAEWTQGVRQMEKEFIKRENAFLWDLCENILVAVYGGAEIKADVVGKGTEAWDAERIRGVRRMEKEFIKRENALLWDLCEGRCL